VRFILIDQIIELVPGKYARGIKHIDPGEDYFRDHFPGFPVVPGVLLTEMMAQTAGKCLDLEDPKRGKPMLARINVANFRDWVRPGETATIVANISLSQPQIATAVCHVEVGQRKVASADLLFSFVPLIQFAPNYRDEVLERFLERSRLPPPGSNLAVSQTQA
jgi:3-hydroxyacyl-[acyl-carrier-protein] dehydratase